MNLADCSIFPSCVSSQRYKIGPVCVYVCVCHSALSRLNHLIYSYICYIPEKSLLEGYLSGILTRRARRGEGRQRSGVFIWSGYTIQVTKVPVVAALACHSVFRIGADRDYPLHLTRPQYLNSGVETQYKEL